MPPGALPDGPENGPLKRSHAARKGPDYRAAIAMREICACRVKARLPGRFPNLGRAARLSLRPKVARVLDCQPVGRIGFDQRLGFIGPGAQPYIVRGGW